MALTVAYSGTIPDPAAGDWLTVVTAIPGVAVYAAAFDFGDHNGAEMGIKWRSLIAGTWTTVWAATVTVDSTDPLPLADGISGYLTPPVPISTQGELWVGFPTGPATGNITYEIYRL